MKLFDDLVQRMKLEITADVLCGRVPATVNTFADLHEHVDANCYGGLCDDNAFDPTDQAAIDIVNAAQTEVSQWIANGGLVGAGVAVAHGDRAQLVASLKAAGEFPIPAPTPTPQTKALTKARAFLRDSEQSQGHDSGEAIEVIRELAAEIEGMSGYWTEGTANAMQRAERVAGPLIVDLQTCLERLAAAAARIVEDQTTQQWRELDRCRAAACHLLSGRV